MFKIADKLERKYNLLTKGQMQEGTDVGLSDVSKVVNSYRLLNELVVLIQMNQAKLKAIPATEAPVKNIISGFAVIRGKMQRYWNPSIQSYYLENPQIVDIKRFFGAILEDLEEVIPALKNILPAQAGKLDSYLNAINANITQIKAT